MRSWCSLTHTYTHTHTHTHTHTITHTLTPTLTHTLSFHSAHSCMVHHGRVWLKNQSLWQPNGCHDNTLLYPSPDCILFSLATQKPQVRRSVYYSILQYITVYHCILYYGIFTHCVLVHFVWCNLYFQTTSPETVCLGVWGRVWRGRVIPSRGHMTVTWLLMIPCGASWMNSKHQKYRSRKFILFRER